VDHLVRRQLLTTLVTVAVTLTGVAAEAQGTAAPAPEAPRRPWIVVGGGATSILGDCTDCENRNYLHTSGFLAIAGTSFTPRTDLGGEFFWTEARSAVSDPIRTAFIMGSFQFRPWRSAGFFVRISAGMAFEKNWIVTPDPNPPVFTSKAFALALGAGWEWRFTKHLGAQAYGVHHVAALGDLTLRDAHFENVVGNFWTAGAAVVIR
jgi:hypothetical protein